MKYSLLIVKFLALQSLLTAQTYSDLWGQNGENWATIGSRLPDVSHAGYEAGEKPVPDLPVMANVRNFGAVGDGITDDTNAIQNAINATVQGAVFIPEGRYLITNFIRIDRSNLVLRGAGPTKTVLWFPKSLTEVLPNWSTNTAGYKTSNWSWDGGFLQLAGEFKTDPVATVTETANRGDRWLTLSTVSGLTVGQWVQINYSDDSKGSLTKWLYSGNFDRQASQPIGTVQQVAKITAIHQAGLRIQLDRPLRVETQLGWAPAVRTFRTTMRNSGFESLGLEFPPVAYGGHFSELGYNGINIGQVFHCWVRDIRFTNAEAGIFLYGVQCSISKVTFVSTSNKKAFEGDSYYTTNGCKGHHGIMVQNADNLISDFDFQMNYIHDLTVQGANSAGNVFAKGRGDELCLDHHRQAPNNNVFTQLDLGIGYRTWFSSGGGNLGNYSGGWETFWNLTSQQGQNYPPNDWGAPSMNFVGLTTSSTSTKEINGRWFEVINPAALVPQNLYEAQRQRIATVGYPPDKFNYWTGGTAAWSSAANWFESLPVSGNKLIFGAAGAGGLMLNNDLGGTAFEIGGITFNSTALAYVLGDGTMAANAGNALIIKGVIINNSAALQTINNPVYVSAGQTINIQGGDIVIKGIISGTGGLIKEGAGTLTLAGNNTYSGETKVVAGILAFNGGSIVDSAKLTLVGGKVQVAGIETVGSLFFDTVQQAYGTWGATGSGAVNINNTYFSGTGKILVAALSTPNVASTWTGASSTDFTQVLNWASPDVGAFGGTTNSCWSINGTKPLVYTAAQGSTVNASTQRALVIGSGSNGSMEITGGTFAAASSSAQDIIGDTNSTGSLTINGGNFVGISALGLSLGNGGAPTTSVLNIKSGTAIFNTVLAFNAPRTGGVGGATVNLDGGVLAAATLQFSSGTTSTLNFNGGVYKGLANTIFSSFTDIFIKSGGAQIDTNGFNFTVAQPLLTDPVSTGGGLTKTGLGVLTLSVANTYSGLTRISAGGVKITNPAALGTTAGVTEVNNYAQLELGGGITVKGETLTINGVGIPLTQDMGALRTVWNSGTNTWAGNLIIGSNNSGIGASGYSTLVVSGVVSGGAGNQLRIRNGDSTGETILSGENTYDAPTENIVGTLRVGSLNSVFTNNALGTLNRASSNLGAPTTVERGAIRIGNGYTIQTSLVYTGAGENTDRQLTLINGNGSVVIDQSGSGLLKFTSGILNLSTASRVFTLSGSTNGQGEIAGTITDNGTNKISLNKMGTGTWTLSGANTYSGDTTVQAGILRQTTGSAFADSAAVRIAASGATLDLAFTGSDIVDMLYFGETLQVPGVWGSVSSSAKNKSNLITGNGLISVTRGAAVTAFASWASAYGVTGGATGDSDKDGIPNLAEYALALNPTGLDGSPGTMVGNVIKFTKRAEAVQNGDVRYSIETSTDLGSGTAWTVVTPLTDTSSEISYALPLGLPKIFVRLRVILVP